jgi:DNA ligase 1
VVALAHAAVLAEKERGRSVLLVMVSLVLIFLISVGKKWSNEKLAARLEEGADILKSVYRQVGRIFSWED